MTYTCVTGHVYFHDENTDDDDTTSETAWCSHTARWWNCVDGECDADFTDTPLWNRPNAIMSWRHYLGESLGGDVSE